MEFNQFSDDLLDDPIIKEGEPEDQLNNPPIEESIDRNEGENEEIDNEDNLDAFSTFLLNKGIRGGKTVVYEDDNGEEQEVAFSDLSKEKQLEILNSITDPGLTEQEIETINYLRQNGLTLNDVASYAVQEYKNKQTGENVHYSVDDYSDDEVFVGDLKIKYPTMTDEEIQEALDLAKSNENLYTKQVSIIREQYKQQEENQAKQQEQEEKDRQIQQQSIFMDALDNFNEIPLDYKDPKSDVWYVEDSEKNAIYDYVFTPSTNGNSKLINDLSDPKVLVEFAWHRLYGKDVISDISNYWKDELKNARKENKVNTPKANVTVKDTKNKNNLTIDSIRDQLL